MNVLYNDAVEESSLTGDGNHKRKCTLTPNRNSKRIKNDNSGNVTSRPLNEN